MYLGIICVITLVSFSLMFTVKQFLLCYCKVTERINRTENRKNDLIIIMTPEKQDKTLELSKHWSVDSTPARNEVIMKRTYPVKSVKCDKICSNY